MHGCVRLDKVRLGLDRLGLIRLDKVGLGRLRVEMSLGESNDLKPGTRPLFPVGAVFLKRNHQKKRMKGNEKGNWAIPRKENDPAFLADPAGRVCFPIFFL